MANLGKQKKVINAGLTAIYLSNSSSSISFFSSWLVPEAFRSLTGPIPEGGSHIKNCPEFEMMHTHFFYRCALFSEVKMAEPNPQRQIDATHGELSKVFIVYPHNPEVYKWSPVREQQLEQEKKTKEDVRLHDKLVHHFAQYLESLKITVAYEYLLRDLATPNYMKWFQDQIADSDYVILIITNSFCHFLSNQPPEGKERIFTGHFLHTFVNNPKKPILPVFLNRQRELDLLPDALRASTTYVVRASSQPPYFNVQQRELDSLYALLTKQNRVVRPPTVSAVPVIGNSLLQRRQSRGEYF